MLSFGRQVFFFLNNADQTLDPLTFCCRHGESLYVAFASSDSLRCFECGDIGHKRFACPPRTKPQEGGTMRGIETCEDCCRRKYGRCRGGGSWQRRAGKREGSSRGEYGARRRGRSIGGAGSGVGTPRRAEKRGAENYSNTPKKKGVSRTDSLVSEGGKAERVRDGEN